jgi:glycosyltransferase involved in cell wall biosynthesis
MLRLAHLLVDRVGTSTPDGFRIPSTKVTITGQGIDTDRFQPGENQDRNRIVSIGRISPVKHYEVLIDAMHLLRAHGRDAVRLEIIGGATLSSEVNYRDQLRSVVARLALDDTVTIRDGVPHHAVAHEYQQAAIFASCSQTGSLDKAVLEAASTGAIPITTNPALASFFGPEASEHMPEQTSAADLARSIDFWLSQSPQTRRDRASMLRERVIRAHSVGHLTDELVRLARPLPSR